ncbi:MAG TPA: 3-oxoacyl-ACP reductase FabG [Pseudomonadales bacterium]|nr:3-oxoacyl-ACP reductase FabG [Pseudomonadales bacterium]
MSDTEKVVLVTGASRGIGKAIALNLAAQGLTVVGTATTPTGAENIQSYLQQASFKGAGLVMNVTDAASVEAGVKDIQERFGVPLIVVNNAGITRDNLMVRMKEEEWDEVIDTNLSSLYRVTKVVLRGMTKARWGRIVNIGSVVGATGNAGQCNYAAAKSGLEGFTRALAQEVASRNITVNAVAPGFIATDMTQGLADAHKEALLTKVPLGRLGQPEEIAAAVSFLVSEGASYITGSTVHVNGGMFMA